MSIKTQCNGMDIQLETDCAPFTPQLSCKPGEEAGIFYVTLTLDAETPALFPDLKLTWELPSVDLHHKWNPRCMQNRALDVGLGSHNFIDSSANNGAPVYSLYNLNGTNACTWALSDVIHNTKMGGDYHSGKFFYSHASLVGTSVGVVDHHELTVRFDFRRIPYYEALNGVVAYWETLPGCQPCHIPDAARKPLLSSWYIYEIRVNTDDLETNCGPAKDAGFDTVILDDGWQTPQTTAGYENNGDWEVCEEKAPDLVGHVKRVQAMGMKYMVWFSVPFVGIESKAYERFKDMLVPNRKGAKWFAFDMRFPEVRQYLVEKYENFVTRYGIDGLKMDFIGSCNDVKPAADVMADGRRDCASMGEGMCKLLAETTRRLKAINPDILIEFRQAYTGPAMRAYGNMLRAVDCPNSVGDNRVRTLDVRLLAGNTAVHSDPITWHDDEPDYSAAMQIIHALFSVPQISRKVSELTPSHLRMLKHQLAFVKEHEDVLQLGELRPLYPHLLYPMVIAKNAQKMVAAIYADMPVRLGAETIPDDLYLVNGSYATEILVELEQDLGTVELEVVDCCGDTLRTGQLDLASGLNRLSVPPAAHIHVKRN